MLDLEQIEDFYPEKIRPFKRNMLREYLQYKILEKIYSSEYSRNLTFMGGTALRIIHSNDRFSEDLDFDNLGLKKVNFIDLTESIKRKLYLEGYKVETKNVIDKVFRSHIKIKEILYNYGLSEHPEEKLNIQVDTEPQNFEYTPNKKILNKFDVFIRVNVVPLDVLLSQKVTAIFTRPRKMGRDFYDVVFLLGKTKPDLNYLREKLNIQDYSELKKNILSLCDEVDFEKLARDIEPFLIDNNGIKKVLLFKEYIKDYNFY